MNDSTRTDETKNTEQVLEWIDSHPQWPPHEFMEPCGSLEGTNHCWACGSSKASHRIGAPHDPE